MKEFLRYTAFLIAALTVLTLLASCAELEETTVSDTTDIPVIETEPSTYGVTGIDDAQLITGVSTKYALLVEADTLQAVAAKNSRELMYPASMTKVMTFIVAYENARSLETELKLLIAMGRVANEELIAVASENLTDDTFVRSTQRLLKRFKKQGIIRLFVFSDIISDTSRTEVAYLFNKYPGFSEGLSENGDCFVINL